MTLCDRKLFLGFPVDSLYQTGLFSANPKLLSFYVQENGSYLQEHYFADIYYLGCPIPSPARLQDLELLGSHIFSLLTKLVPNYSFSNSKLMLMPLIQPFNKGITSG
ncbi:MAG: hypothetical protein H0T62_06965 [Parachlamydiaceae bacterium]|nr:hypothetical protein [Parachlamydiaceae bacterium]